MHVYDYRFLADLIPASYAGVTNLIYDLRACNEMRRRNDSDTFERLREAAVVESVRGSNAIEGIVTTRARLEGLIQGEVEPITYGEQEILGYRKALREIYSPDFAGDLTEDYVRHLHATLLYATSDQAGRYKSVDNMIRERDEEGHISVRFVPVSASDTPDAMRQLVLAYKEARQDARVNPLALVACVIVDFLCIHPFMDGNGRVSRLLTTVLLQRAGFDIGRYISLEGLIDEHKAAYYDALRQSSEGWHGNTNDYGPFIVFLLQILYAGYTALDARFVEGSIKKVPKAKQIETLLMGTFVPISKLEIRRHFPDVSVATIERVLTTLIKEGKVEKIGTYRDARYRRTAE